MDLIQTVFMRLDQHGGTAKRTSENTVKLNRLGTDIPILLTSCPWWGCQNWHLTASLRVSLMRLGTADAQPAGWSWSYWSWGLYLRGMYAPGRLAACVHLKPGHIINTIHLW